ncbi:MAG: lmo0937 family membrane protein [Bacilli bacterium]|nr:lmo0937 family membrane protein [Bacilli bacterium]
MDLLRWIGGIVVIVWLLGFLLNFGGSLIHLLLIIAAVLFIADKVFGKRI